MKKTALISVSDKTGLVDFAKSLSNLDFRLLTTSGSGKVLKEAGISTTSIENYTGQLEILDGRVKTLHPKIHAGLLAKRDLAHHMQQLETQEIWPIDVAIINLYPFVQNLKTDAAKDPYKMIELVDIGGPTMIRAAAKNFKNVLPLIDPSDYSEALNFLSKGIVPLEFRRRMAVKVFTFVAQYNLEIARYFSQCSFDAYENILIDSSNEDLSPVNGMVLVKSQDLRYGENPHQKATFYSIFGRPNKAWHQLSGKELSYNNLLDFDAALEMISSFEDKPTAIIIKHLNPCGVASAESLLEALNAAKRCDPRSHFGGIVAFNGAVTADVAEELNEGFVEIVLAPEYEKRALEILMTRKNLRIIQFHPDNIESGIVVRNVEGGVLMQERDSQLSEPSDAKVVSKRIPTASELEELKFAWKVCRHVKSNAVVVSKNSMILGVGAGQMSRIDSTEVAILKARTHGHSLSGAVCASDAFFPFPDSIEKLLAEGVRAFIVPGGAKRDEDVIKAIDAGGAALMFANDRHFRH